MWKDGKKEKYSADRGLAVVETAGLLSFWGEGWKVLSKVKEKCYNRQKIEKL